MKVFEVKKHSEPNSFIITATSKKEMDASYNSELYDVDEITLPHIRGKLVNAVSKDEVVNAIRAAYDEVGNATTWAFIGAVQKNLGFIPSWDATDKASYAGWQPIETAPHETEVLVYSEGSNTVTLASFEFTGEERVDGHVIVEDWWQWVDLQNGYELVDEDNNYPTHWMPFNRPEKA